MAMKKAAPKKKKSEYGSYGTNDVSGMGVAGRGTKAGEAPYTSYGLTTKRGMDQAKRKAAKPIKAQSARMTALAKASKKKK